MNKLNTDSKFDIDLEFGNIGEEYVQNIFDGDSLVEVKLEEGGFFNYLAFNEHRGQELLEDFYEALFDPNNKTSPHMEVYPFASYK